METTTTAEDLKHYVCDPVKVTVEDQDGSKWTFEILPVSLFAWDETATWTALIKEDPDAFLKKVKEAVGSPSESVVRNVLVRGVKSPKLSYDEKAEGCVPVNDLMRRDVLVTNLYTEIVNLSFEKILKAKEPHAKPAPGHKG